MTICPDGFYGEIFDNTCQPCNSPCVTCKNTKNSCTSCIDGKFLTGISCINHCEPGLA